ncbi:hypothetical protein ARMGADRAFT_1085273 [Armillaria gallica]|uniref:Uncharacterized protein n=1 Tax=Armillaria gallica TaxID=47427 RepID=A0A2H3D845_ARMGA|nr:hypothetical protein ARMGADRAFT_1085273 [Armillaria gallica]
MSHLLTNLMIHLSEHHSGRFVSHMDLSALKVLSSLKVYALYHNVYVTMWIVSMWVSPCKESLSSVDEPPGSHHYTPHTLDNTTDFRSIGHKHRDTVLKL